MKSIYYYWILAIIITLGAAYYQRKTGPTYPVKDKIKINNNEIKFKLPRSCNSDENAKIEIESKDSINLFIEYKRFNTEDEWIKIIANKKNDKYFAELPMQPPAGKLEYNVIINESKLTDKSIIIRFKGPVPAYVLIPHIIFIFISMLFSNLTGILAIKKHKSIIKFSILTFLFLLLGGMIFGPIVQKFAFGEYWTGIPFGWDLTDNKTLIAFIAWALALGINLIKRKPILIFIASIIMLIIFSIPHSMFGSELNYNTGQITTGK